MTRDSYIEYTKSFFRRWIKLYDLFAASIFNVYDATVRKVKPREGLKVLDICTGTGEVAIRLAAKKAIVTAIDITDEMLTQAKSKASAKALDIDFRIMDARKIDFPDKYFDVVVISNALHDMPRKVRLEVLKEARRLTKENLVIADYELPKNKLFFAVWFAIIRLFETPYFPSYAREGIDPLLLETSLPVGENSRVFPGLFSIRVIIVAT